MRKKFIPYKHFIKDIYKTAKQHGVKLKFTNAKLITLVEENGAKCAGYFDSESQVLAASLGYEDYRWLGLLAHESSHMDQWIEDLFLWEKCLPGYNLFFEWLHQKKIVTRERLEESVQDIIRLEKDCEERAIKKIKKYKLPVDIEIYIKKANCYLYAYLYFLEKKVWIERIYDEPHIWNLAPSKFQKEYKKIPRKLYRAYVQQHKKLNAGTN